VAHQDFIGFQHRADALRNDKTGVLLHDPFQFLLDLAFGLYIHRAGTVIQDENRRFEQECPGDGDALLLPAGKVYTALAQDGIVAIR
jgi:hypothetical protein